MPVTPRNGQTQPTQAKPPDGLNKVDNFRNALMESGNGLYKTECIGTTIFHDGAYKDLVDVEYATAGWVEWYNNRRLHSAIEMLSPIAFENAYYAGLTLEEQLV